MKNYSKMMLVALSVATLVSCADDKFAEYMTEKPESIAQYEYLQCLRCIKDVYRS